MKWASDLSPAYNGDTGVLYGQIHWLCSLSEGSVWEAVLPFVPKGYSITVDCSMWEELQFVLLSQVFIYKESIRAANKASNNKVILATKLPVTFTLEIKYINQTSSVLLHVE